MTQVVPEENMAVVPPGGAAGDKRASTQAGVLPADTMSHVRALKEVLCGPGRRRIGLADLELGRTVGKGSFGRVRICYLKDHLVRAGAMKGTRRGLAVKILSKPKAAQSMGGVQKAVGAVKQEIQILNQLEFPFVVNMIAFFHDGKRVCILTEFVNAGELASLIRGKNGEETMRPELARHLLGQILLGLGEMHRLHIVYRDLKAENCLLDFFGNAKLVDMGLAKQLEEGSRYRTRTNCGTMGYQAPELLLNKWYTVGVDWWSFGVLAFVTMTKQMPWGERINDNFVVSQAVMSLTITWPKRAYVDRAGRSLIKQTLLHNERKRLNAERGRKHSYFNAVDWTGMVNLRIRSPFTPKIHSEDDTSYFNRYPESVEESGPDLSQKDRSAWEHALDPLQ